MYTIKKEEYGYTFYYEWLRYQYPMLFGQGLLLILIGTLALIWSVINLAMIYHGLDPISAIQPALKLSLIFLALSTIVYAGIVLHDGCCHNGLKTHDWLEAEVVVLWILFKTVISFLGLLEVSRGL